MSSTLRSFLSILLISQSINAKSFHPCELKNELLNIHNLSLDISRNLTCVAQKFSGLNTNIIVGDYYGIFQIKSNWCGEREASGECNIKCTDLLDDDITDDILCAQKIVKAEGKRGWRLKKHTGCLEEFKYLNENCHKEILPQINDEFQDRGDICEAAKKLMTSYDISKIDAIVWSCIAFYSKTGYFNLQNEKLDDSCVKTRNVECAIKEYKQTGTIKFSIWPAYKSHCKSIQESTCHESIGKNNEKKKILEKIVQINSLAGAEASSTNQFRKKFTTSTEISVIIEDEEGKISNYRGDEITTEGNRESLQTTEFLSHTLEKPDDNDESTIGGYSKVRIMFANESSSEESEVDETTQKIAIDSLLNDENIVVSSDYILENNKTEEDVDQNKLKEDDSLTSTAREEDLETTTMIFSENHSELINKINSNRLDTLSTVTLAFLKNFARNNSILAKKTAENSSLNAETTTVSSMGETSKQSSSSNLFRLSTTEESPTTTVSIESASTLNDGLSISTEMVPETSTRSSILTDDLTIGTFEFCEFSYQLMVNGTIDLNDLPNYSCIAHKYSQRNSNDPHANNERFGIFGLKSNTCGRDKPGGLCEVLCSKFLDDDLDDDIKCAKNVVDNRGFEEWDVNENDCNIYKSRILKCIIEDKFSLPSDENEEKNEITTISPMADETTTDKMLQTDRIRPNAKDILMNTIRTENIEPTTELISSAIQVKSNKEAESVSTTDSNMIDIDTTTMIKNLLHPEQNEIILDDSLATTVSYENTLFTETTESDLMKSTTESLYFTSIREIIDEYKKAKLNATESHKKRYNKETEELILDEDTETTTSLTSQNKFESKSANTTQKIESNLESDNLKVLPSTITEVVTSTKSYVDEKSEKFELNKCTLAIFLKSSNFAQNLIAKFVCIAEHESNFKSTMVTVEGSIKKYGLFQIDDNSYCSTGDRINECNVQCDDLTDNNFENDFKCIKYIYDKNLFYYWPSYEDFCRNIDPNSIDHCFENELQTTTSETTDRDEMELSLKHQFSSTKGSKADELESTEIPSSKNQSKISNIDSQEAKIHDNNHSGHTKASETEKIQELKGHDNALDKTKSSTTEVAQTEASQSQNSFSNQSTITETSNTNLQEQKPEGSNNQSNTIEVSMTQNTKELKTQDNTLNKNESSTETSTVKDTITQDPQDIMSTNPFIATEPSIIESTQTSKAEITLESKAQDQDIYQATETSKSQEQKSQNLQFNSPINSINYQATTTVPEIPKTTQESQISDDSDFMIKKFELCELARELYANNKTTDDIPIYLCIADVKSQLEIKLPDKNTTNYGLFHINSQFCGHNKAGGLCSMDCADLWDDDITDDIECMDEIDKSKNFGVWNLMVDDCVVYESKLKDCMKKGGFGAVEGDENSMDDNEDEKHFRVERNSTSIASQKYELESRLNVDDGDENEESNSAENLLISLQSSVRNDYSSDKNSTNSTTESHAKNSSNGNESDEDLKFSETPISSLISGAVANRNTANSSQPISENPASLLSISNENTDTTTESSISSKMNQISSQNEDTKFTESALSSSASNSIPNKDNSDTNSEIYSDTNLTAVENQISNIDSQNQDLKFQSLESAATFNENIEFYENTTQPAANNQIKHPDSLHEGFTENPELPSLVSIKISDPNVTTHTNSTPSTAETQIRPTTEQATPKIYEILKKPILAENDSPHLTKTAFSIQKNVQDISIDQNSSKLIDLILRNITNSNAEAAKNGSIIFNIFNFNIYGDNHDIKYSINSTVMQHTNEN